MAKFKFSSSYFALTIVLFIAEVLIAAYMHDAYIRPFGGDFLVVILIYCFIRSFVICNITCAAIGVLLFAYLIEFCQWFHLLYILNLQNVTMVRIIMGIDFAWADMLMYTLGIILVWLVERGLKKT